MKQIDAVLITSKQLKYLHKRGLLKQFYKQVKFIESGKSEVVNLKVLKPTNEGIRSFRINKQFRVVGTIMTGKFIVLGIDNHQ